MRDHIEARVRELVADFKLEEALEVLLAQAQTQSQRKQNTLLVLKGKLALLESQNLGGMLDPNEVARQKATLAHQILDIADGSLLDGELPAPKAEEQPVLVQKTGNLSNTGGGFKKYLLLAGLLAAVFVAGVFISRIRGKNNSDKPSPILPQQPTEAAGTATNQPFNGSLKVLDFPNLNKPFNFLDAGYEFAWANAEMVSDQDIQLKIRAYIACKSNLGICYRASLRIFADGKPISPQEESNTAGWVEQGGIITNDLQFVLPIASEYHLELSKDDATWRRAFKILQ